MLGYFGNSPGYLTPVLRVGYYHHRTKLQISYCFTQRAGGLSSNDSGLAYPGFFTVGASYIFGVGTQKAQPLYEISFTAKERVFRRLLLRFEGGIAHQVTVSKLGVGSSLRLALEFKTGISDKLRLGIRAEEPFSFSESRLGIDSKSFGYYYNSAGVVYTRRINTRELISSYSLFAEYVLKSDLTKDVLSVAAGVGLYKIRGTRSNSYKDNGVTIELPPLVESANLPGLYLRVGQRFGAFSHSAFVNIMPGQVPVTFGIQAGLGLNVFGKKGTGGE